jgi:type II secretory pathway pseudopilin PulG
MNEERGFILPVVMILVALLSSLFLFATKEWSGWREKDNLRLAMVQASYAAESGIAYMQVKLREEPDDYSSIHDQIGSYQVDVSVWELDAGTLMIQAVAKGNDKVQQTETAEVEKSTLKIKRWLE